MLIPGSDSYLKNIIKSEVMCMEKLKLTKKENFENLLKIEEVRSNADLVEFINHEIDLLNKKSASRKLGSTKSSQQNIEIMQKIKEVLAKQNEPIMIKDLLKNTELSTYTYEDKDEMKTLTSQKISALIKKMLENGEVQRTVEKGNAYFSIAE